MKAKKIANGKGGEVKQDIRELLRDLDPNPFGKQTEENLKEWMNEAGYVDLQEMCIKVGASASGNISSLKENILQAYRLRNAPLARIKMPESVAVQRQKQKKMLDILGELE